MRQNPETPVSARDLLVTLSRHRGKMMSFLAASVAAALAWVIFAPRTYESTAQLYIRLGRESVTLDPTATTGPTVQFYQTRESEINTILQLVDSREIAAKVVDQIGADVILSGPKEEQAGPGVEAGLLANWIALVLSAVRDPESDRSRAIRELQSRTNIWAPPNSSVVAIQCMAPDPNLAQRIVQTWADLVVVEHLRVARINHSYEFFIEQADLFHKQLEEEERKLRDAKVEGRLVSLPSQETVLQQALADIRSRATTNRAALASSSAKLDKLQRAMAGLSPETVTQVTTGMPRQGWDMMRDTFYKLQANEADFNARYTAEHPRMKAMQSQRQEAEKTLAAQVDERRQSSRGPNPVYQALEQDLLREQALLAGLTAEGQSLRERQSLLDAELAAFNRRAVDIRDLERNVAILESKYHAHTEKMEQARIDEALEQARISSVNVMQPASFVEKPVSPRKLQTLLIGLGAGLFGGIGLALAAESLSRSFVTPSQVEQSLGLPVLSSIPAMAGERLAGANSRAESRARPMDG